MRKLSLTILAILLSTLLLSGCSKEEESISEKASKKVDEITTKAADTMVKKIRTPLDKARGTKNLSDERTDAIDRMMKEQ
jgi:outer membrane murein-binding lipoprotein Lpp